MTAAGRRSSRRPDRTPKAWCHASICSKQHANVDLQDLFLAGQRDQARIDAEWTYDAFLQAAQQLHAAGYPFGNPIGQTADSQDWLGPLFLSFGAQMVSPNAEITVVSDATRAALST